jgi:hypothetical protein
MLQLHKKKKKKKKKIKKKSTPSIRLQWRVVMQWTMANWQSNAYTNEMREAFNKQQNIRPALNNKKN